MAVSGFGAVSKTVLPLRSPIVLCGRHARRRVSASLAFDSLAMPDFLADAGRSDATSPPHLPPPTTAPRQGYDVYLVGGCVRDLIMNKTPRDFDIITSADLRQVQKMFQWCDIIGKRFPICHVHVNDFIVEVSSFHTSGRKSNGNLAYIPKRPSNCKDDDYIRWKNCLARDFTINGLMFNPYSNIIYDYLGGMEDIKKAKVRTVNPAHTSFQQDCARILRAIRTAARLGFSFSKNTAISVRDLSGSILRLDKGRLLMEMNYMLAYGSAEASLRLLWKFGILELLLPIQAAYFVSQGFRRRDDRFNMLLEIPAAGKFREKGLLFAEEMDIVFGDIVATGDEAYTPASGVLPDLGGGTSYGVEEDAIDLERSDESDDMRTDTFPVFNQSYSNVGTPMESPVGTPLWPSTVPQAEEGRPKVVRGKKRTEFTARAGSLKKKHSPVQMVSSSLEKLATIFDSHRTKKLELDEKYSAKRCLAIIKELPIENRSKLYFDCMKLVTDSKDVGDFFFGYGGSSRPAGIFEKNGSRLLAFCVDGHLYHVLFILFCIRY